ncbi:unnamed protein product, partial [Acanthocheilonema viteae]
MDSRDTHVRAKVAIENRDRMRSALGIKDDFIDGTSFEKLNKSVDLKVDEIEKGDCKRKKKKSDEELFYSTFAWISELFLAYYMWLTSAMTQFLLSVTYGRQVYSLQRNKPYHSVH